ncbi:MAG: hypothetical protein J1F11_02525 [Oscillospiraceae bacterium]|nr:hypothetical protein [Oscillospiraceae bacterium]
MKEKVIRRKRKKRLSAPDLITCIVFFALIISMPIITGVLPKKDFSEMENTYLQKMPEMSVKNIFKRKYMNDMEKYISDHFAGRVGWIKGRTVFETSLGKHERNGIYILKNRLAEKINEPDYASVDKNIEAINKFAEENDVPVFFLLVPTSAEIYADELPKNAPNVNQKEFISYVYGSLGKSVTAIDVYQTMLSNRDDYIYYRTDHHWTTKGAYLAYAAAGKKMGYTPEREGMFDVEHAGLDFIGTFYSKALYDGVEKDTLDFYHYVLGDGVTDVSVTKVYGEEPEHRDSMYFREYLDVKDKYSSFLGTNAPLVTIKTDGGGGKLLIIKDSYAHCYSTFLTGHYSEITLMDMRYINMSYKELIDPEEYDQVLFLYNASSFMSDTDIRKLAY